MRTNIVSDFCDRVPKKTPLQKVTLKLYFGRTRNVCALLNLHIQVQLRTQKMSCEICHRACY